MQISFHGAVQTVTGSQHLITVDGKSLLLDCGLYQGKREEARRSTGISLRAGGDDAVVLSHAHIDHSGNLPNLVKQGFRGKIICTTATADLCGAMLLDSGHIQEEDVEYVNRQRRKHGEPPVEPIYTREDAAEALQYFEGIEYERAIPAVARRYLYAVRCRPYAGLSHRGPRFRGRERRARPAPGLYR